MLTYSLRIHPAIPAVSRAVALGIFDGIHLGHRAVISRAAGIEGTRAAVFTFEQPAWELPKEDAWELLSPAAKIRMLETLGVEELFQADFEAIRGLSPEAFVRDILRDTLHAKVVACGYNYHFGRDGAGDAQRLRALCAEEGIETRLVPAVLVDGQPVSASRIRRCIEQGEVQQATRLLGHSFTLDFTVVGGQKLGRLLGTPTINQPLPPHFVRPRFGVYASSVEVKGRVTHGVTNIGVRPTVGADGPLAETWIASYSGDLYGQNVPVSLVQFLRPEEKFASVEALQAQILRDAEAARTAVLGETGGDIRAVFFDFDDTLQNRPAAFLQFCAFFLDRYFPSLPPEEKQARALEMLRLNNHGYVNYLDYFLSLIQRWQWTDAPPVGDIYREFQFRFPEYSTLFPDTADTLRALREKGYRLGVITNGPSVQQNRKLDVSGLRPLVDICMVSGDEQVHKPDPEIFRRAAARLGVGLSACVYVGDHLINDIEGSRAAGMRPVFINVFRRDPPPPGVPEIHSLSELCGLLDAWKTGNGG